MLGIKNCILICFIALSFGHYSKAAVVDEIVLTLRGTTNQNYNVNNFATVLTNANFNSTKKSVVWLYGLTQLPSTPEVQLVVDAYQQNGNYNFIQVSMPMIRYVFSNAKIIGDGVGKALDSMFVGGYSPSKVHIVGFSLGGQISGRVGRYVKTISSGKRKIGRITGIDPCNLDIFTLVSIGTVLTVNDAIFVDTVKSESVITGSQSTVGHVNFYVNGGISQPMCDPTDVGCSHSMGPKYWAESIRRADQLAFAAKKCTNWNEFIASTCSTTAPIGYMGASTIATLTGSYYLSTNLVSPYSRT